MMALTMTSSNAPFDACLRELRQLSAAGKTGLMFLTCDGKHIAQIGLSEGRIEFLSFRGRYGLDALPLMAQSNEVRSRFQEGLLVSLQNNTKLPPTSALLEQLDIVLSTPPSTTTNNAFSTEQQNQLLEILGQFLGPMAQMVGPEKIATLPSWDAAVAALAPLISGARQCQQFLDQCTNHRPVQGSQSSSGAKNAPLSPEQHQKLIQLLARFIGPMADILGNDELSKATHFDDAVSRLCRVLNDKTAEKQFVEQAKSLN